MRRIPGGSLVKFFILTYAVMWTCFITVAAAAIPARRPLGALLVLLGAFAPSLVALGLTARAEGVRGIRTLLAGVLRWRVAPQWYLFAAGYIPAIKLTVALVHRVATGAWPRFGNEAWYIIPLAIAFSTPFQAGEEIGWRGYALPRLAARFGLARASLLLGLIWACWHLPQFFIPEADTYRQSFFVYVLSMRNDAGTRRRVSPRTPQVGPTPRSTLRAPRTMSEPEPSTLRRGAGMPLAAA